MLCVVRCALFVVCCLLVDVVCFVDVLLCCCFVLLLFAWSCSDRFVKGLSSTAEVVAIKSNHEKDGVVLKKTI